MSCHNGGPGAQFGETEIEGFFFVSDTRGEDDYIMGRVVGELWRDIMS